MAQDPLILSGEWARSNKPTRAWRVGMNERDFWLLLRRALLMVVKAIEKRFGFGERRGEK